MQQRGPIARAPLIQCDRELYTEIATTLQFAIAGKPVLIGDSLADLVERHCPELYRLAAGAGFQFVPNTDPRFLEQKPPQVWFDIIRVRRRH